MEKFAIGMLIGGIGGALLVANNYKMRTLVKKSQEEVQTKLNELLDERIKKMDECETDVFNAEGQFLDPETDQPVAAKKKPTERKRAKKTAES